MASYFNDIRVPTPRIVSVEVGGKNAPGVALQLDGEVATDIQTAGAAAPGAAIVSYFAENSVDGIHAALTAALKDTVNKPSVISISYGSPEGDEGNSPAEMEALNALFIQAARLNVTVIVSSGDTGSTLGANALKVEFPASSPFVLSCGGTSAVVSAGFKKISSETVWNEVWKFQGNTMPLATGGGFSAQFTRPPYQETAIGRGSYPQGFRGVPDVAASADPSRYGYFIRTIADAIAGGTSAAAPLWAALIARINQKMGARGFVNPDLYAAAQRFPASFKSITQGNNSLDPQTTSDWQANPNGWDPCTGLGCPNGAELLKALLNLQTT
jgi:kumamolisin